MDTSTGVTQLSPLDQIQQAEAEVARRIAAAREGAEVTLQEARAQMVELQRQARETGRSEGQMQYQEIVSRAEDEARALIARAHRGAEILRRQGESCMDAAVREAVQFIIGRETEVGSA